MINRFSGRHYFLSNFYPCLVEFEGMIYPSVEHAFQSAKTLNMQLRKEFRVMASASDAKYWGKHLALRPDWESVKDSIMYQLLLSKFRTPSLSQLLLSTDNEMLEEGNSHGDKYWGVVKGEGKNVLGKLLMTIREELRNGDHVIRG